MGRDEVLRACETVAERVGGRLEQARGWWDCLLRADVDGVGIAVQVATSLGRSIWAPRRSLDETRTLIWADVEGLGPLRVDVRQGFVYGLGQDIVVGDGPFDDIAIVKSNDPGLARSFLGPAERKAWLDLYDPRRVAPYDAFLRRGTVELRRREGEDDPAVLERAIRLVALWALRSRGWRAEAETCAHALGGGQVGEVDLGGGRLFHLPEGGREVVVELVPVRVGWLSRRLFTRVQATAAHTRFELVRHGSHGAARVARAGRGMRPAELPAYHAAGAAELGLAGARLVEAAGPERVAASEGQIEVDFAGVMLELERLVSAVRLVGLLAGVAVPDSPYR